MQVTAHHPGGAAGMADATSKTPRRSLSLGRPLVYLVLLVVAFLAAFPFYWIVIGSLMKPVELFGRVPFPAIGELPYLLTLGGHGFYWFELGDPSAANQ